VATSISAAMEPSPPAATARPSQPERPSTTAAHRANASDLAGSLVRYVVAGLCVLIVLLVALLLLMRSRREHARGAAAEQGPGRGRPRGQHEQRRPEPAPGPVIGPSRSQLVPPAGPASTSGWAAAGGWQGGSSLGEMQPTPAEPFRPAMAPAPRAARTAVKAPSSSAGPPWAPAPEPERMFGLLPGVPNSALPPDPGPGIRVPGDMTTMPAVPPGAILPPPYDLSASPDPDFPPRPASEPENGPALLTGQSLGFAAAPVPVDYAPPQAPDFTVPSRAAGLVLSADTAPVGAAVPIRPQSQWSNSASARQVSTGPAGDPSYIWDLAATDVFPAAADPGPPTEAPGAAGEDGDPGAS
jgi:hypothetical protein